MPRTVWTKSMEKHIRKNIHLSNQVLAEQLHVSLASVENKVRALGLARIFQPEEIELLEKIWGKSRTTIEKSLPRFTWRQISKKANNIGLPPLHEAAECAYLYSIINAMGENESIIPIWKDAGLHIKNDKAKKMKHNILLVSIDGFWEFAIARPDIVDATRLGEDAIFEILGSPPQEFIEIQKKAVPFKRRNKHAHMNRQKRKEIASLYASTNVSVKKIANRFGVSEDTVRHAACEYKKSRQKRPTVVTDNFCKRLEQLYYKEGKTYMECASELNCSISSIGRGIHKLVNQDK